MNDILNIAAYKFVPLDNLEQRRAQLREFCNDRQLKGTILLTPEGINCFIAGSGNGVRELIDHLHDQDEFADLEVKESYSDEQPFERMLIKIKQEIICFGIDGIEPREYTSKKLPPKELQQWLDAGKPVTLLDVRNDYEVEVGTFENARAIGVDHFRDFPAAVDQLPEDMKSQPIVMFCTGGIRCEKAGPYMERAGFQSIYQLEGGILKYFEECGGAHYDGECFVFDKRVALDPSLAETDTEQCFACLSPLTLEDQQSPHYVVGFSCPHCHAQREQERRQQQSHARHALARFREELPGSQPYINRRPLNVPGRYDGWVLIDFLADYHQHVDRDEWERLIDESNIIYEPQKGADTYPLKATDVVRGGNRLYRLEAIEAEPAVNANIEIIHEDDALIVVNKPAPLPMHACGRYNKNTLEYMLRVAYAPLHPRPAHRLDANTTGVAVFCKTRKVAARVQPQFESGQVEKRYLALVHGHPTWTRHECELPIDHQAVDAGARETSADGQSAITHFDLLEKRDDGTSLLAVKPITGRTNQIRLHLWELNLPIVGDPVYLRNRERGSRQTLDLHDPPMHLHAHQVSFTHPETNERVTYESQKPHWT